MKRLLCVLLAVMIFVTTSMVVTYAAGDFKDIDGHWAKADIEEVASKGIIKGISETEFAPDLNISRAEFLALIIRALGAKEETYKDAYNDVKSTDWYANTVQTGKNLGIIDSNMTPDNNFAPTAPINREEMTSFIINAYSVKIGDKAPNGDISVFADKAEISSWALGYVEGAYALSIIKGVSADKFSPKGFASRAQAATIIKRFLELKKPGKSIKIFSIGNSYTTDCNYWLYPLLKSEGYDDIILGMAYCAGRELKGHHQNITENLPTYDYRLNTEGKWKTTESSTVLDCLKAEDWDYVIIQNSSDDASRYNKDSAYGGKYIDEIIKFIKSNATNPNVKIGFNMAWAYQQDSDHEYFSSFYNADQKHMYQSIANYCKNQIVPKKDIEIFVPTGTSVQNARTSYIGDTITRDGRHLDEYFGKYVAALTWYSAITGVSPENVSYVPNKALVPEDKHQVAKEAVANALSKPYVVTNSQYKSK